MPQPWVCSSPLVIIHLGSDPGWDQTGQLLLGDCWLGNRNRALNRRKRMKRFRIRLRTLTFGSAVAVPHTHAAFGSRCLTAPHKTLVGQHPGCVSERWLDSQIEAWLWSRPQNLLLASLGRLSLLWLTLTLGRPRAWWQERPLRDWAAADARDVPVPFLTCAGQGERTEFNGRCRAVARSTLLVLCRVTWESHKANGVLSGRTLGCGCLMGLLSAA